MSRNWIAVASADHVRRGRADGFMQVCHGKAAPLRRIKPGDWIAYYSPTATLGGQDRIQALTAIGIVSDGAPYAYDMGGGFVPFRRDVAWMSATEAPIRPILHILEFSADQKNWGYQLRFGLFQISDHDIRTIATHMGLQQTS